MSRDLFLVIREHAPEEGEDARAAAGPATPSVRPSWVRSLRTALVCLVLWWVPVGVLALRFG